MENLSLQEEESAIRADLQPRGRFQRYLKNALSSVFPVGRKTEDKHQDDTQTSAFLNGTSDIKVGYR